MTVAERIVANLEAPRPPNTAAKGKGPMAAVKAVSSACVSNMQKCAWLEESRLDAILGSSSRSHKSVRSGIRCWIAFVGIISSITFMNRLHDV